jgi:hypothetical protein
MKIRDLDEEKKWDYENGFYWFSSSSRLNKLLENKICNFYYVRLYKKKF